MCRLPKSGRDKEGEHKRRRDVSPMLWRDVLVQKRLRGTHNFPSLKERTKMLSFFMVASSWQSGLMTLLKQVTAAQGSDEVMSACLCERARKGGEKKENNMKDK